MGKKKIYWIALVAAIVIAATTVYVIMRQEETKLEQGMDAGAGQINNGVQLSLFHVEDQPVKGEREAPIQIVEIGDYKCPSCKRWSESVYPQLEETYINSGQAAFYYMNEAFLGPDSLYAAMAGEYMLDKLGDDGFWQFHELLLAQQGSKDEEWASIEFLTALVTEHFPEINADDFRTALEQHTYEPQVQADMNIAEQIEVERVPSVYVNGILVDGMSYEDVQAIIDAELTRLGQ